MGLPALLAAIGAGTDHRYWRWIGVAAAIWGCVTWIQQVSRMSAWPDEPLTALALISVLIAHINIVLRAPLGGHARWLISSNLILAAATAVLVDRSINISSGGNSLDWYPTQRLAAAGAILWGFSTLAIAVLTLQSRRNASSDTAAPSQVTVICPLCGNHQLVIAGDAPCDGCGARIHITVQPPIQAA